MASRRTSSRDERAAALSELFLAHHRRLVGLAALLVDDRGAPRRSCRTRSFPCTGAGGSCATRGRLWPT
jgi:hypothetical protein